LIIIKREKLTNEYFMLLLKKKYIVEMENVICLLSRVIISRILLKMMKKDRSLNIIFSNIQMSESNKNKVYKSKHEN